MQSDRDTQRHGYRSRARPGYNSVLIYEYNAAPQNAARKGRTAKTELLFEDTLRAQYIVETYAPHCGAVYLKKKALSIVTDAVDCITGACLKGKMGFGAESLEPMIKKPLAC